MQPAARVEVEPTPVAAEDRVVKGFFHQHMSRRRIEKELGVVRTGRDAVGDDLIQHVGDLRPSTGPGFCEIPGLIYERGILVSDRVGVLAQQVGHVWVDMDAVVLGGDLGGEERGHRAGEAEASLHVGDGVDSGGLAVGEREDVKQVQLADQIEGGTLPARRRQRRGVTGVLYLVFSLDDAVEVGIKEQDKDEGGQREQEKNHGLPGAGAHGTPPRSVAVGAHQFMSSM